MIWFSLHCITRYKARDWLADNLEPVEGGRNNTVLRTHDVAANTHWGMLLYTYSTHGVLRVDCIHGTVTNRAHSDVGGPA